MGEHVGGHGVQEGVARRADPSEQRDVQPHVALEHVEVSDLHGRARRQQVGAEEGGVTHA